MVRNYKCLLCFLLIFFQTRCGNNPAKNLDYVGRGYNIFIGNPLDEKVDIGFMQNIFEINYNLSRLYTKLYKTEIFSVRGVDTRNIQSCSVNFKSTIINHIKDYKDALALSTTILANNSMRFEKKEVEKKQSASGGQKLDFGPFSLSGGYRTAVKENIKGKDRFVLSKAHCDVYEASILTYNPPSFTESFKKAIRLLPGVEDITTFDEMNAYLNVFRVFGTHLVSKVVMGSEFNIVYKFSSYHYRYLVENEVNLEAGASFDAKKSQKPKKPKTPAKKTNDTSGSDAGATVGISGSLSVSGSYQQKTDNAHTFANAASSKTMYSKGARIPKNGDSATWAANSKLNPVPIRYTLVPLANYGYYDSKGEFKWLIDNDNDRSNMRLVERYFYSELMDEQIKQEGIIENNYKVCNEYQLGDKCINYVKEKRSWFNARMDCLSWGGDLIEYRNVEEELFVKDLGIVRDKLDGNATLTWTSLNNLEDPSEWVWGEGSLMTYNHFDDSEELIDGKNCVAINLKISGAINDRSRWTAHDCDDKKKYICERVYDNSDYMRVVFNYSKIPCDSEREFIYPSLDDTNIGRCVKYFPNRLDYYEARDHCFNWAPYANLVSIPNEEKDILVSSIIEEMAWIGLNDAKYEGLWLWEEGSRMKYDHWLPGQPNALSNQDCAVTVKPRERNKSPLLGWLDVMCDIKKAFVCERPYIVLKNDQESNEKYFCDGELIYNNFCIKIFNIEKSFNEAIDECSLWSNDAHLVIVNEDKKKTLLGYSIKEKQYKYWIGLSSSSVNTPPRWETGTYLSADEWFLMTKEGCDFTNENLSQMYNVAIGNGDCLFAIDKVLSDSTLSTARFICERPITQDYGFTE